MRRKFGWLIVLCCCVSPCTRAQEWTRFRGPNGSGIGSAPTVPAQFTEKDYNWNTTLPGGGHSSPVLWGDRIFVTCSDRETATRYIVCVNAADGAIVWKREIKS